MWVLPCPGRPLRTGHLVVVPCPGRPLRTGHGVGGTVAGATNTVPCTCLYHVLWCLFSTPGRKIIRHARPRREPVLCQAGPPPLFSRPCTHTYTPLQPLHPHLHPPPTPPPTHTFTPTPPTQRYTHAAQPPYLSFSKRCHNDGGQLSTPNEISHGQRHRCLGLHLSAMKRACMAEGKGWG